MSDQEHKRIIEALLFAAADPLNKNQLAEYAEMGERDVLNALDALHSDYQDRGFVLVEMDGHYAFRTAADLGDILSKDKNMERRLSRAAMETLAIIAYHQPVTRAEIENIRGVATHKGTLDTLIEAGWVKPGRRRETPGRPLTWVTTTAFLDHFSLESIMELPGLDDLKASGLLDRRPAIEALPETGDLLAGYDDNDDAVKADIDADYADELEGTA